MPRPVVWALTAYAGLMAGVLGWAWVDWQTHYRKRLRASL